MFKNLFSARAELMAKYLEQLKAVKEGKQAAPEVTTANAAAFTGHFVLTVAVSTAIAIGIVRGMEALVE